jgi:ATP-dependent DNA helicase DinG
VDPVDAAPPSIFEIFSAQGVLQRTLPSYEYRAGQLDMALAVERALNEERTLLCEAGTGTGKTMAYLVPAILSGKKVVVSTATRALQEQIVQNDLPLIEQALGFPVHAAVMKGLGNYLCLRRYQQARMSSAHGDLGNLRKLVMVENWAHRTHSGDLTELGDLAEGDALLTRVASSSDTRIGSSCPHHEDCFVTRMKREAAAASLVIVNHHLFFADLALRGPHPGRVLPDYEAVIFDEAHHLEDIATQFFSVRVSSNKLEALVRDAENAFPALPQPQAALAVVGGVRRTAQLFFEHLRVLHQGSDGKVGVHGDAWQGAGAQRWHALDNALEALFASSSVVRGEEQWQGSAALADELEILGRRAEKIRQELADIVEASSEFVAWVELSERNVELSASPVELAPVLQRQLFETIPATILTSATLCDSARRSVEDSAAVAADGKPSAYRFMRQRLGLDEPTSQVMELVVPTPFDFEKRALLYVPEDLPIPGEPGFSGKAAQRAQQLIDITDGGAFVLTTSLKAMREIHGDLRRADSQRLLLMQGEAPKHLLLDRFRAQGNAVLVATLSFWEGVDVPGKSLRLVIMDKVPFAVPTDPILRARADKLENAGRSGFRDLYLPLAQRLLKQGFGRLIRHHDDAGVVAVLDARLRQKSYGKRLLAALPPAPVVGTLPEVSQFWSRYSDST